MSGRKRWGDIKQQADKEFSKKSEEEGEIGHERLKKAKEGVNA